MSAKLESDPSPQRLGPAGTPNHRHRAGEAGIGGDIGVISFLPPNSCEFDEVAHRDVPLLASNEPESLQRAEERVHPRTGFFERTGGIEGG
jgi:hypothetical protein